AVIRGAAARPDARAVELLGPQALDRVSVDRCYRSAVTCCHCIPLFWPRAPCVAKLPRHMLARQDANPMGFACRAWLVQARNAVPGSRRRSPRAAGEVDMDFEKFTERARGFVQAAQSLAVREGHQRFTPEHVLKVLMDDTEGMAQNLVTAAAGNARAVRDRVEEAVAKLPKVEGSGAGQLYLAPETARVFEAAQTIASKAGDSYVTVERLLLALAMEKSAASRILADAGVTPAGLNGAINELRKG